MSLPMRPGPAAQVGLSKGESRLQATHPPTSPWLAGQAWGALQKPDRGVSPDAPLGISSDPKA